MNLNIVNHASSPLKPEHITLQRLISRSLFHTFLESPTQLIAEVDLKKFQSRVNGIHWINILDSDQNNGSATFVVDFMHVCFSKLLPLAMAFLLLTEIDLAAPARSLPSS